MIASAPTPRKEMLEVLQTRSRPISQSAHDRPFPRGGRPLSQLYRLAEADDAGDIFGARSHPPLVVAAVSERLYFRAAADIECPRSLGPVYLVRRNRYQVGAQLIHLDVGLSQSLHRVHVEGKAALPGQLADLRHRLDSSGLVVGVHDGYENHILVEGVRHRLHAHPAELVYRHVGDLHCGVFRQVPAGVPDRVVFDRGGDDTGRS